MTRSASADCRPRQRDRGRAVAGSSGKLSMRVAPSMLVLATVALTVGCSSTASVEPSASTPSPPAAAVSSVVQTEEPDALSGAPDRPAPAPDAPAASAETDHSSVAALHAQGVDHQVGDYRLRMNTFTADATSTVLAFSQFNQPPSEGAYALATWTVTYTGTTEGAPYADLATAVMGADGVQYEHNRCSAVIKDGLFVEARVLNPGGTLNFSTCYDAPPEALTGATAVRAGTFLRTDRVDWSTRT